MTLAYLINQYPGISHTFIRREIEALERRGIAVARYAIRSSAHGLIATEDPRRARGRDLEQRARPAGRRDRRAG